MLFNLDHDAMTNTYNISELLFLYNINVSQMIIMSKSFYNFKSFGNFKS